MKSETKTKGSNFEFQAYRYFPPKEMKMPRYVKRMIFWYGALLPFSIIAFISDDMLFDSIAMLLLVLCIAQYLFSYFFMDQKIGKLEGLIKVNEDFLIYKGRKFFLKGIEIESIKSDDYFKRKKNSFHYHMITIWYSFEPNLSRGTDNYIKFTYEDEDYTLYFVLESEEHLMEFDNVLWLFVRNNCLDYKQGAKYLRIEGYSEIQKFKSKYYQN